MKKLLSVLIAFVLCAAVFTGCTNSNKSSDMLITVDSHYDDVNETAMSAYEKLCTAVINGEEDVRFNTARMDEVNQLFYTCFPLYPLVESIDVLDNNTGVSIKYKNDIDTHNSLVSEFNAKISDIMKECRNSKVSIDEYIFNVYTYLTSNFEIDADVLTVYDTVIQGRGYNAAVNSLFEYLVLQGGGKASHVVSSTGLGIISLVEFSGEYYFFDPAKELEENAGNTLVYFAMDSSRAASEFLYTDNTKVETVEDDTFSQLALSQSFTVEKSEVLVKCTDASEYILKLD